MTVAATGSTVDQISHRLLCDALRETVHAEPATSDGIGSIRYRASAVLYRLLLEHPIDRRGRCRKCRGPGGMIGLRRRAPCQIHLTASDWMLRQPDAALLSHLTSELGAGAAPGTARPSDRSGLTVRARRGAGA